ncbi:hypothetical protein AYI68_g4490 [Smittium mucronatum]|uniref:Uncharacterized protein n=1 Tax=Smittium mucronatum TaxID=133383 RepID=A0A1R0GWY3_9FUNG|nr:hypothetical protein AYI68_g4490 [Smittium mucronatum]
MVGCLFPTAVYYRIAECAQLTAQNLLKNNHPSFDSSSTRSHQTFIPYAISTLVSHKGLLYSISGELDSYRT